MIVLHMSRAANSLDQERGGEGGGEEEKRKRGGEKMKEEKKEIEKVDNGAVISGLAGLHVHLVSISFEGTGCFYLASDDRRGYCVVLACLIDRR